MIFDGLMVVVALNGLFVAVEFGFVKIRATQLDDMAKQGTIGAGMVEEATTKLDPYLCVRRLGITLSSPGLGWGDEVGGPRVARVTVWEKGKSSDDETGE